MVGRDDVGVGGDLLDLALTGIGHAGQEVDQPAGDVLVGGFQVQDHGPLVLQMVRDLGGIFKPLRLYQHHLQLGGGVDIDHLVAAVFRLIAVVLEGIPAGGLLELLKFLVLILIGVGQLFQFVNKAHGCSLLVGVFPQV